MNIQQLLRFFGYVPVAELDKAQAKIAALTAHINRHANKPISGFMSDGRAIATEIVDFVRDIKDIKDGNGRN